MFRGKMTDDMEKLVRGASGFSDIRKAAENNESLKDEWLRSLIQIKRDFEERFLRLKLNDQPFKVNSIFIQ